MRARGLLAASLLAGCGASSAPPPPAETPSAEFLAASFAPAIGTDASPPAMGWRAAGSRHELFIAYLPDVPELRGAEISDYDGGLLIIQQSPRMIVSVHVKVGEARLTEITKARLPGTEEMVPTTVFGVPAYLARGSDPCRKLGDGVDDCRMRFEVLYVIVGSNAFFLYSGADERFPALADLARQIVAATTFAPQ